MSEGSLVARVYTSQAEIPLLNAAVSVLKKNGRGRELLAFRLTDPDGLTDTLAIEAPDAAMSRSSAGGAQPFAVVDVMAEQVGYDRILVEDVQVFAGVETRQDFLLIPTAELPDRYDLTAVYNVTPQNL